MRAYLRTPGGMWRIPSWLLLCVLGLDIIGIFAVVAFFTRK